MEHLLAAARRFPDTVHRSPERFTRLGTPQQPDVLLITCSDSRVVPSLVLDADPGQVFELRNAGGVVHPYAVGAPSAEAATVEYAIDVLGIRDVIVCGHSHCGAVAALVGRDVPPGPLPAVQEWLAPLPVPDDDREAEQDGRHVTLGAAVQQHVLSQVQALLTHPAVARRSGPAPELPGEPVRVRAWFLDLTHGRVLQHDPGAQTFTPL